MKNIIKIIVFIFIFCIIWYYVFYYLWLYKSSIAFSYDIPKNSVDIVYIGSSTVDRAFNPMLAYDLYGFVTEILSSSVQPFPAIKFLIKENMKRQSPKLYIIDIQQLLYDLTDGFSSSFIREVTDRMKFSKNRIDLINELLSYNDVAKSDYINYYFSFFLYHNNWKQNEGSAFWNFRYKGYFMDDYSFGVNPQLDYKWATTNYFVDKQEFPEKNKQCLLDLINYIKQNHLNVLFVVPKKEYFLTGQRRINAAISIIKANDFDVLNFNTIDDTYIDFQTDFYDDNHLNVYGSIKYTLYLSQYLIENYDLPNHKGDDLYISWDEEYLKFKNVFDNKSNKKFDLLVNQYMNLLYNKYKIKKI